MALAFITGRLAGRDEVSEAIVRMFSIAEIEYAINYWRERRAPAAGCALCAPARVLATVYERMIFERLQAVAENTLDHEQGAAIIVALDQLELPL